MIPIALYQVRAKQLMEMHAKYKSAINSNSKIKWMKRGTWTASIAWAAFLVVQSVPYYQAIAAGEAAYKRGAYDAAAAHFKSALDKNNSFSNDDLRHAKALNNLAECYRAKYQLSEAEALYRKSELLTRKLPQTRPEIPMAMHNLASIYRDEGRFNESYKLEEKALSIYERNVKQHDGRLASILSGLGKTLRDRGDYNDALIRYEEALKVQEEFYGKNEAANAGIIANLGGLYRDQGRYDDSMKQYNRALQLDVAALGRKHPYVATDYNNLGCLYRDLENFEQSKFYFLEALKIRQKVFNQGSPLVAKTELGLAELAIRQNHFDEAKTYLTSAQRNQQVLPANHPDRAIFYNLMGDVCLAQGDAQKAVEYQTRCLQIREPATGSFHPDVAIALADRAVAEYRNSDKADFQTDSERATRILHRAFGDAHPVTKRVLAEFKQASDKKSSAAATKKSDPLI